MKKLFVVLSLVLSASAAMAAGTPESATQEAPFRTDVALAIALSPVTVPIQVLAFPFDGMMLGYKESAKIQSDAGRTAVRVAMAPLWIPAAALKAPGFLVEQAYLFFSGLGSEPTVVSSAKQ